MKNTNWLFITIAYVTLFGVGFLDTVRAPYFPDITRDLQLQDSTAALFFAVSSFVAYVAGRCVPALTAKLGLINTLRLGQVFMGAGFALIAMADSLLVLVVTCIVFGFGFGIINVAQNLFIVKASSGAIRRRLLSGLHSMYALASLLAPLLVAYLFSQGLIWRQAYVYFALFTALPFIGTFFTRDSKDQSQNKVAVRPKMEKPHLWIVATLFSFYLVTEIMVATRLPLYLQREFLMSPAESSKWLAMFFFWLLMGRLFFLFVPMRAKTLAIIEWSLIASFVCLSLGLWVNPIWLTVAGLTMSSVFALALDLMTEIFPDSPNEAISYCIAVSCLFVVSMHLGMGAITEWIGIGRALMLGPLFLLLSWSCVFMVRVFIQKAGVTEEAQ